ncbi:TetR/AcrR family transcriptional regulator [Frankia nepalensis]|uniref:TetR/AcrR family transcriptional regulator n=1 Tax=Frankia nepalensis TaxID=1836974 RepID=UPI0027DBA77D|nr:TetR/AcrR family transcriptional regulator [Frankia nepalensis]
MAGAIALADVEGLDAVTIRRLAQEHQVTPMALYRHFRDKEELFDGIAERLFANVALAEPSDAPWHEQLRDLLGALTEAVREHPAVAGLVLPRIMSSPPGLELAERGLAMLRSAGFSVERAAELGTMAVTSAITLVTSEPGAPRIRDPEARDDEIRAKRARLAALSPRRYPNVVAAADALTNCASPPDYYRLGLDIVVAGIREAQPR